MKEGNLIKSCVLLIDIEIYPKSEGKTSSTKPGEWDA